MGLSAKWSKNTPDGWAGFLHISFPPNPNHSPPSPAVSFSGPLTSKARSTLSICGLLVFTTFLLFTLSTFEPSSSLPRRLLLTHRPPSTRRPQSPLANLVVNLFNPGIPQNGAVEFNNEAASFKALQGMGVLYRRGTRAMPDLVVAHVSDAVEERGFRDFLRILHTDGLLARSDLSFVFSSSSISAKFSPVIREENESLMKLVLSYNELNRTSHKFAGLTRYFKARRDGKKESKEAIWGKGFRFRETNSSEADESTRPGFGSMVGFDASELDPENSLSGFLDHVPMGFRRWACYPMLLGRVRRSYKHVMLADVESVLVLNDPFRRVRNRSPESVHLWTHPDTESGKRGKRQSRDPSIMPGIIVGGSRGVRRFSDAVLTEIVRTTIDHKGKSAGKSAVTELGIVSQLVRSGHLLKNVNVLIQAEPIPEVGELFGSDSDTSRSVYSNTLVVHQGNGINVSMRDLL